MTEMDLLWPALAAVLPGLWSYGRKKRMTWTGLALLLLPVLIVVPGSFLLWEIGLTWRCAVWRACGMWFLTGIAMLFVWAGAWVWHDVSTAGWHAAAVWLCRGAAVAVLGVSCVVLTFFSSFLIYFLADFDFTETKDGQKVVVQYIWDDYVSYAYHGPLLRSTEPLEGSRDLD